MILGVREVSTFSEIKNQYKFLSKKYHPDVATEANSDAIMKKINWAWDEIKIYKKTTKQDKFSSFLIYFNGLIIDYNRSIIRLYAELHENGS
ncbi:DnaJ domain-containing protein [Lactococcus lactis]|uniref:DnaJ domain-containing protein n=1 Tax=Lactococcus lactis TaxID=1358 RepID=UPI003D166BE4